MTDNNNDNKNNINTVATKGGWLSAFVVATVWFGTHVGGGFASGNQIVSFFSQYGLKAVIYALTSVCILAVVMWIVATFARLYGYDNYKDTFAAIYPHPKMEILFEIFYLIIVLAAVAAAVAGAGNVLANMLGINYDLIFNKLFFNLLITAILILLTIFGVKLVIAASSVMSVGIIIISSIMIVVGLSVDYNEIAAQVMTSYDISSLADFTDAPGTSLIKGIFAYSGLQCLAVPPVIAASQELSRKGRRRFAILGALMNGCILAGSVIMLVRWYPLLAAINNLQDFGNTLSIPNQTVLVIIGMKWLTALFSVFCFLAFVSTCVTLIYTMIQRFQPYCLPKVIKSVRGRSVLAGVLLIGLCFSVSLLGLTAIVKILYGYDGFYGVFAVIIPVFIWGLPKVIKGLKAGGDKRKSE